MRQWSGGWPWRASRNQNWLGSVNPMTRRRRRLARRRVALGEGGERAPQVEACCGRAATTDFAVRTSSLISSTRRRHRSYAQGRPSNDVLRIPRGTATVSSIWDTYHGGAVGGVVSVLFTLDRRLFFKHDDGTIRVALDWERDEVFLQMLSWRD